MDTQRTKSVNNQKEFGSAFNGFSSQENLNIILAANSQIEREKTLFKNYQEQVEASLMKNPLNIEKTFGYFGLLLGTFPPASIFFRMFQNNPEPGIVAWFIFINLVCAVAGFFSGKLIGKLVLGTERFSWNLMVLTLPFIGILWGLITGGIGGFFFIIIGAFFGAAIAAIVGSIAVPAFTVFHRLLKRGEFIERNLFLPLAFGITFIISAFILGL